MRIFKTEKEFLERVENQNDESNRRNLISEKEIQNIKSEFPGISPEYIHYLLEIGAGSFRECQFNVASNLFDLSDLGLEEYYEIKSSIKFFGDNFSGDFSGFDFETESENVVEFWHESGEIFVTNKKFKEYILEQMLMDKNGNDLRNYE